MDQTYVKFKQIEHTNMEKKKTKGKAIEEPGKATARAALH